MDAVTDLEALAESLDPLNRAVLASVITTGSPQQREAIRGPDAAAHVQFADAVAAFVSRLDIDEPDAPLASPIDRVQFLAESARVEVRRAYPQLHPEVARRAGNLYAFLNR